MHAVGFECARPILELPPTVELSLESKEIKIDNGKDNMMSFQNVCGSVGNVKSDLSSNRATTTTDHHSHGGARVSSFTFQPTDRTIGNMSFGIVKSIVWI